MILTLLTFIHPVFGTISIYAGVVALLKIFAGQPFERSSAIFLKAALAASVTGLLFPSNGFHVSHLLAMAAVYAAAIAVLAWRGFHLTRSWGLVFVLSLMGVLCLDFLMIVQHLFGWLSVLNASDPGTVKMMLLIAESAVALLFTAMCIFAVVRYRHRPSCL